MNDQQTTQASEERDRTGSRHVIFVDGPGPEAKQTYDTDVVDAATIIANAGYAEEPEEYVLEALRGQSEDVVEQFDPQGDLGPSEVDLTDRHRVHFRVTTRGQVFI